MKLLNYLTAMVIVLAAIIATIFAAGNLIKAFIDFLSLLVILLYALPMLIGTFGWKNFWGSFALAFSKDEGLPEEYARAAEVVTSAGRQIYLGAALATFIGFIGIFSFSSPDILKETSNFSVALLGIFYGMIINLILIEPIRAYLKSKS
ncbi:MAG: hypothetical protein PQJ58_01755 [Spirochaetales bacterium]|nr:hypothetical protein [Spirochaetales bacterium]